MNCLFVQNFIKHMGSDLIIQHVYSAIHKPIMLSALRGFELTKFVKMNSTIKERVHDNGNVLWIIIGYSWNTWRCTVCNVRYNFVTIARDTCSCMHDIQSYCFSGSSYVLLSFFLVDQIYHLASPASPPHYMYNPIKV